MPMYTVETLSRPTAASYLSHLWVTTGLASKAEEDEFIPADGIACYPVQISVDCAAVIVQLPPPERITEAYFVALVVWHEGNQSKSPEAKVTHRFITLERGENASGAPTTILGEWDEGCHLNYGEGLTLDKDAFLKAVLEMIAEP